MAIKKTILKKKIEGVIYDLYFQTSADLVTYDESSTVATKIAEVVTQLNNLTTGDNSVDAKVKAASDALYAKIMGVTNPEDINQAYDTLKEVADYLSAHGSVVDGFTSDIKALKTAVGDSEGGLVKDVADNAKAIAALQATGATKVETSDNNGYIKVNGEETKVYDDSALKTAVDDLTNVGATKVEASETNGYIKIDGAETKVYDDSAISATKITEDDSHKFVTTDEKTAIASAAKILVAKTTDGLGDNDLLFYEITGSTEE